MGPVQGLTVLGWLQCLPVRLELNFQPQWQGPDMVPTRMAMGRAVAPALISLQGSGVQ